MVERREVILARVFFSDSPESKVRPAIVLSDDRYHETGFALLAAITTSADDYCLPVAGDDVNCSLEGGSHARYDGVVKLHARQIIKRIGKVTPEFHARLVEKIIAMLKKS